MIWLRIPHLFFVLVLALVVLRGQACCAVSMCPQVLVETDDEGEYEDDADYKNNPWQIDERKLFAAKKFQLTKKYAIKIAQIQNICELDKKQVLKLKIASKGATEQALEKYTEQWEEQLKRYGGFNNRENTNDEDEDEDDGKEKVKKKKKRFVVNKVEEIDAQVLQMMDQNWFGGMVKSDATDVAIWNRTVEKVLNDEQEEKLTAHIDEIKLATRDARADAFIANMRSELALSESQLDEFDELVRPAFLKKDIEVNANYEAMATLYLGSKYNKKKMKKLLSEEQNLILALKLKPAAGYAGMFGDNNNANVAAGVAAAEPEMYVVKVFEAALTGLAGLFDEVGDAIEGALE